MNKEKIKNIFLVFILILSFETLVYGAVKRPSAKEIPNGSLIIGTHIISLKALNQSLLDIALKSGEEQGQKEVYYKSEFANGTWYNIADANGIEDIIQSDKAVSETIIDNLVLTHWTKEDGKTIDLETGAPISLSDIGNIKDPHNMEELKELVMEEESTIELLKQDHEDKENQFKKQSLNIILKEISTKEFYEQDTILKLLENYQIYLRNDKKASEEEIFIIEELKERVKNQRDFIAYQEVYNRMDGEAKKAQSKGYTDYANKVLEKIDGINKKISDLTNKLIQSSMGPLDKKRDEFCKQLIENVEKKNTEGANGVLEKIFAIDNIKGNRIVLLSLELSILDEALSQELSTFKSIITQGESKEYKEAKSRGESQGVLQAIKQEQVNAIKDLTGNIETLKGYIAFRRSSNDQKIDTLNSIIGAYEGAQKSQPKSNVYEDVNKVLKDMIDKLEKELLSLQVQSSPELQAEKESKNDMENQIQALNNQYLDAIEKGDMEFANQLKEEMNEMVKEMESNEIRKTKELSELLKERNEVAKKLDKNPMDESLLGRLEELDLEIAKKQQLTGEKDQQFFETIDEAVRKLKAAVDSKALEQIEEEVSNVLDLAGSLSPEGKTNLKNSVEEILKDMNATYIDLVKQNKLTQAEAYNAQIEKLKEELGISLSKEEKEKKDDSKIEEDSQAGEGAQAGKDMQIEEGSQGETSQTKQDTAKENTRDENLSDIEKELSILEAKLSGLDYARGSRRGIIARILLLEEMKKTKRFVEKFGDELDKKLNEEIELLKSVESESYSEEEAGKKEESIKDLIVINRQMKVLDTIQIITDTDSSKHFYAPVMRDHIMLVCLREVTESLGAKVKWIDYQQKTVVNKDNIQISCIVGSNQLLANSVSKKMPFKVVLIGERVYVPLEFVLNQLGYASKYKSEHNIILIYSKALEEQVKKVIN